MEDEQAGVGIISMYVFPYRIFFYRGVGVLLPPPSSPFPPLRLDPGEGMGGEGK